MKDQKEDTQCCVKKQAQDLGPSIALLKFGGQIYSNSISFPAFVPPHITLGYIV